VRFIQVASDGTMTEQGFFAPLGGSSSSSKWAPSGDVVYSLDYDRGIDIIRWRGPHYVPGKRETGRAPGTNGTSVLPALDGAALARHKALAASLEAGGWSPGVCRLAATT
jgi:hypothetical protein